MSTLLFGMSRENIPVEERTVRATTEVLHVDSPPAEAADSPDWNERETDPNPDLSGIPSRQVASDWHESQKYPANWASAADITPGIAYINSRQSSVGTAAQRELTDQQGHGTMAYAVGIEPVLRDGAVFGADYFAIDERSIQDGIPDQMERPLGADREAIGRIANAANVASRDAAAASLYSEFYRSMTGR